MYQYYTSEVTPLRPFGESREEKTLAAVLDLWQASCEREGRFYEQKEKLEQRVFEMEKLVKAAVKAGDADAQSFLLGCAYCNPRFLGK